MLALTRRRYPGCSIASVRIEPGARLAEHVRVAHNAEIRSNVSIGRWTYIEPYTFVNGADIGSFCAIGRNVAIGCFQHPYGYPAISAKMCRDLLGLEYDDPLRPVSIGSDVWIGEGAIMLGGWSRCCRDPRRRAVLDRGGAPAGKIGQRFDGERVESLLSLRWWELPDEEILAHRDFFAAGEDWEL